VKIGVGEVEGFGMYYVCWLKKWKYSVRNSFGTGTSFRELMRHA